MKYKDSNSINGFLFICLQKTLFGIRGYMWTIIQNTPRTIISESLRPNVKAKDRSAQSFLLIFHLICGTITSHS